MNSKLLNVPNKPTAMSPCLIATLKTVIYRNLEIQFLLHIVVGKGLMKIKINYWLSLLYLLSSKVIWMSVRQVGRLDWQVSTIVVGNSVLYKTAPNAKGHVDQTLVKTVCSVWKWTYKKEAWKKGFLLMVKAKFLGWRIPVSHVALDAKMELITAE